MGKTISQRVLELSVKNGVFDRNVARKSFRQYDSEELHNSVMRRARELSDAGLLSNKSRGVFVPTQRGRNAVAN